MGPALTTRS
uniref:Uncharacterized protein n=1 Tax=Moniliophthora roreri TaxID=221103 RepID=A0A0W0FDI5_MONRR